MKFFLRIVKSSKTELIIVASVIFILFCMPVVALASITNLGAVTNANPLYTAPANPKDLYDYGNCTYWAALRRIQIGQPIPNTWGNANTWAIRAKLDGYQVDHHPTVGSIMQTDIAPLGHVAFVESVDERGDWTISEMNVIGFDQLDNKTLSPQAAIFYNFIH